MEEIIYHRFPPRPSNGKKQESRYSEKFGHPSDGFIPCLKKIKEYFDIFCIIKMS